MKHGERIGSYEPAITLDHTERGLEVRAPKYSLLFNADTPYIQLQGSDGTPWVDMLAASGIVTTNGRDVTYNISEPEYNTLPEGTVEIRVESTTEQPTNKTQVWRLHDDFIETYVTAKPTGKLAAIEMLGGVLVGPNMFGESMSQRYFESVYNPQPCEMEQPITTALAGTHITTSGMWKPGRRREFLEAPFCFGFNQHPPKANGSYPAGPWLMAGLSAPIEQQNMVEWQYAPAEDGFSLKAVYDNTEITDGELQSPSLLLFFADNPMQGLQEYTRHATELGHLQQPETTPRQWAGNAYVTWGRQLEEERARRAAGELGARASELLTPQFVLDTLHELTDLGAPIDRVVIDDKWQADYGTNMPNSPEWYKLVQTLHAMGMEALMWVKAFAADGLPPELCILDAMGRPIAGDPTNPGYIEQTRAQASHIVSPHGLDTDGIKLDFLAQLPHGPGLRWHGNERGHAALYNYLQNIHDAIKTAKPNSTIQSHVVSPWFRGVIDEVRINDSNYPADIYRPNKRVSLIRSMGERVRLATALMPDHPIDYDGWPLPKEYFLRYARAQAPYGRLTSHYTTSVDGEPLSQAERQELAALFQRAAEVRRPQHKVAS